MEGSLERLECAHEDDEMPPNFPGIPLRLSGDSDHIGPCRAGCHLQWGKARSDEGSNHLAAFPFVVS